MIGIILMIRIMMISHYRTNLGCTRICWTSKGGLGQTSSPSSLRPITRTTPIWWQRVQFQYFLFSLSILYFCPRVISSQRPYTLGRIEKGKNSYMFSWVELDPKFWIWAFSAIFALSFWVAKNLIYIDNAFNGYSYLKSTRKELSDGTLMLEKEYRLAR